MEGSQNPDPRRAGEMGAKGQTVERKQRGITAHTLSESNWRKSHLLVQRWESEKHMSWGVSAQGFCDHFTEVGCVRGWSVVQLEQDEEVGPMHGMYGTLDTAHR